MRSIKYELVDIEGGVGLRNEVAEAIVSDYRTLYGPINFDEFLTHDNSPSLMDFWLKALSLGFVFSNQNSIENEFLGYLGKKTIWQNCYNKLAASIKDVVDEQAFCQFLIKAHRGVERKTDEQRQKIIFNLVKKSVDPAVMEKIAKKWSEGFSLDKDQLEFKCTIFAIPVPKLPERSMTLSFALDPSFPVIACDDRTEFMDRIVDFYESRIDAAQTKRFLAIGDNGNYFNGVFGNLLTCLKQEDIDTVAKFLDDTYGFNEFAEIRNRLGELKKLADKIDDSKLVNKWSDYRSDFNGTVESWYSNRVSKQEAALEQLDGKIDKKTGEVTGGLRELLKNISDALPGGNNIKEGILAETLDFLRDHGAKIDRRFSDELESYLATLKTDLNEWSQNNKENELPAGWQRQLSKRIQSSPLFFGENKYALWKKLLNLKELIREDIKKLETVIKERFDDYEITDKQVDMLAVLWQRISSDGDPEIKRRLETIERELRVKFADRNERKRFFVSGYERTKVSQLAIENKISVSRLVELSELGDLYEKTKSTPQENNLLRDTVHLSKIVVSALVRGSDKEREVVLMHSNLGGYSSLISRRKFITRSTLQAVNGGQVNLGIRNNRYVYALLPDKFGQRSEITLFNKTYNFTKADLRERVSLAPALEVRSSKYQVQFLDWFMGLHNRKKTELGAGGAFCIAEKTIELDWSGDRPQISKISDPRVFVSQPFEIKPRSKGTRTAENRFIGVDIGEYGLAWNLIEANDGIIDQLESGFIADPQQQKLKSAVKRLRENQVRATFNSSDTRIARIRESLIGTYRNQLEDLAVRKNARLSFEYEVSAFEAGGSRISRVYNSVKRADIRKKDNNPANKMAWGDFGANNWGLEMTAAGTSQTCSRCKRWASLAIDINSNYELETYEDKLLKTAITDGEIRLLGKQDTKRVIKGKDLKILIYKAMRPNDEGLGMEIVKRRKNWGKLSQKFGTGKPRGNIAIFVCPYTDCHHIADADLQAAFNIAIRGYAKAQSDGKVRTVEEIHKFVKDLNYAPVELQG